MQQNIIGWDIGGAHLKAARCENGAVMSVHLQHCPLWLGLEHLENAFFTIMEALPEMDYGHAITMTGELVDLFESRDEGVAKIIAAMQRYLKNAPFQIYAGRHGLLNAKDVKPVHYPSIASANWLASATFSAHAIKNGLFVDIGSTTTDISLCNEGKIVAKGMNDYQRLQSRELVYTGIVRTPVMALGQTALFLGQEVGMMAEHFATTADVYRLTGDLKEKYDKGDTTDGKGKTPVASARRLSRMIGYDFKTEDLALWQQFAHGLKSRQKQQLQNACERQLSRVLIDKKPHVVGAGIGRFLIKEIAADLNLHYKDFGGLFDSLIQEDGIDIADCAPAVAVACLAQS